MEWVKKEISDIKSYVEGIGELLQEDVNFQLAEILHQIQVGQRDITASDTDSDM